MRNIVARITGEGEKRVIVKILLPEFVESRPSTRHKATKKGN